MPDTQHMTHEDRHRALIRRLAAEIKPVRPLWPVSARMGLWLSLEAGVLAWVVTHSHKRLVERLAYPVYTIEIVFFAAAALIFALMALRSALPGCPLRARDATIGTVLVAVGALLLIVAEPMRTSEPLREFFQVGLPCAIGTALLAAPPWLVLWWLVKRGAPMRGTLSGILVGAGALCFSFAMMRIECPIDERLHLLTWHLLPALVLTALSAIAGMAWLQFCPPPASSDRAEPTRYRSRRF